MPGPIPERPFYPPVSPPLFSIRFHAVENNPLLLSIYAAEYLLEYRDILPSFLRDIIRITSFLVVSRLGLSHRLGAVHRSVDIRCSTHIWERERRMIGSHENARRVNCPISKRDGNGRGPSHSPLVEAHLDTVAGWVPVSR